jgi:prevent-host-death family protein
MTSIAVTDARKSIGELVDRVKFAGERIVLNKSGKRAAALVSISDLELLEAMQDRRDAEEAERILSDPRQKPVPFAPSRRR